MGIESYIVAAIGTCSLLRSGCRLHVCLSSSQKRILYFTLIFPYAVPGTFNCTQFKIHTLVYVLIITDGNLRELRHDYKLYTCIYVNRAY